MITINYSEYAPSSGIPFNDIVLGKTIKGTVFTDGEELSGIFLSTAIGIVYLDDPTFSWTNDEGNDMAIFGGIEVALTITVEKV